MDDLPGLGSGTALRGGLILPPTALTSAATILIVAAFGLCGCSSHDQAGSEKATSAASAASAASAGAATTAATPPSALPDPAALVDVLSRLADPAVTGADKLGLVEGASAENAASLDDFTKALRDNAYLPLTFVVRDVAVSDRDPGNVVANVDVDSADPAANNNFSFPMEFRPHQGGWQLSRETADLLLSFGTAQTDPSPTPAPSLPGPPVSGPAAPTPTP